MKRSDMVQLMEKHWSGCQSFKSDKSMFSYILHRMEEAGMLPPYTRTLVEDMKPFDYTQEFLDEHEFTIQKWDKE